MSSERHPVDELADEFVVRYRRGEQPSVAEYVQKHPALAHKIQELFPALVLLEELAPPAQSTTGEARAPPRTWDHPPLQLGEYRLVRELGRGGMGIVYEAEQLALRRRVALKVLLQAGEANPERVQRFQREGRAIARLEHRNIVAIYDASEDQDVHFFVMEYVEGRNLAQLVRERDPLPVPEAVAHVLQAARGLAYIHDQGMVHRDVKPSNLLLDTEGTIKILDLGLARFSEVLAAARTSGDDAPSAVLTRSGAIIGTAQFMAPEQGLGPKHADHRVDIYSLGCTLYHLLTGKHPYSGETAFATLLAHREQPIPSLRAVRPDVPEGLDAVFRRMVAKRPEDRYPSMTAAIAGLEASLVPGPDAALTKPRRRRRVALVLMAAGLLCLAAYLFGWGARPGKPAPPPEDPASAGEELAALRDGVAALTPDSPEDEWEGLRSRVLTFPQRWRASPESLQAAALLARLPCPLDALRRDQVPAYELELAGGGSRSREPRPELVAVLGDSRLKHWYFVSCLAFHPESQVLASGSWDCTIQLWDVLTGRKRLTLAANDWVASVRFSPDGRTLASSHRNGTVTLWNTQTGQERQTFGREQPEGWPHLDFSPDGQTLVFMDHADKAVVLWDVVQGKPRLALKGHAARITCVAFSPDGRLVASADEDGLVKLWEAASGQERATLRGHIKRVEAIAFGPGGKLLASASLDRTIKLWDPTTGKEKLTLVGTHEFVGVAFSADGRTVAGVGGGKQVRLWDPATGEPRRVLAGHTESVWAVAFSPDGQWVASGGMDHAVKIWGAATGKEKFPPTGHAGRVAAVAFSPDGRLLASASHDQTVKVWRTGTGQELFTLQGHTERVTGVAFSPDGRRLASASADRTVKVWDAVTGAEGLTLKGHTHRVEDVAFSPDGQLLASASDDHHVKVWDAATGQHRFTFGGHQAMVNGVAFSPDSRLLASCEGDRITTDRPGVVKVWHAETRRELFTLSGHGGMVNAVAFSPDGTLLASTSYLPDAAVRLWDMATGQPLGRLNNHGHAALGVSFHPEGRLLASSGANGLVQLWELPTGRRQRALRVGPAFGQVSQVVFSAEGRYLATANGNGTVYILRLADRPKGLGNRDEE